MGALLEVRGLRRRVGGVDILAGVDLEVAPGTLTALIGPNGAGKTTLFDILSGLVAPTAGSVRFDGQEITRWPPHRRCALGIGRTFQVSRLFPGLPALDNVLVGVTFGRRGREPAARRRAPLPWLSLLAAAIFATSPRSGPDFRRRSSVSPPGGR